MRRDARGFPLVVCKELGIIRTWPERDLSSKSMLVVLVRYLLPVKNQNPPYFGSGKSAAHLPITIDNTSSPEKTNT